MASVSFRPLEVDDFQILLEWFADPEIAAWWGEPPSMSWIEAKYGPRIEGRTPTSMWVGEFDGVPGGLFQFYAHADYPDHDACVGIPDAIGIDYLVGRSHRGQGRSGAALRSFAGLALRRHPTAKACVATPAQANVASWRALERAGFTCTGECEPPDEPVAFAYVLDRVDLDLDDD